MLRQTSLVISLALMFVVARPAFSATPTTFQAGAYIIPMDRTHQGADLFRGYGLLYALLKEGIPVQWTIDEGKSYGGVDFTTTTRAWGPTPGTATSRSYKSGPLVIDMPSLTSAQRSRVDTVITTWKATRSTTVHVTTAAFTADVERTLRYAPRIAVFADGKEDVAFGLMNAAGIPDSAGNPWPSKREDCSLGDKDYTSPDVLCQYEIEGPSATATVKDGALFDAQGYPLFCHLDSMHYDKSNVPKLVYEVRRFAEFPDRMHLKQCAAIEAVENQTHGFMLTPSGISKKGPSGSATMGMVDDALGQFDGTWAFEGGSVDGFVPVGGSYHAGVTKIVSASNNTDVAVYGHLDGNPAYGQLVFLGGHEYSTDPTSNASLGARLFLNTLMANGCASNEAGAPDVGLGGGLASDDLDVTVSLDWVNAGAGFARDGRLVLQLPVGVTVVSTDGGTHDPALRQVRWTLGVMPGGATDALDVLVRVPTAGSWTFDATLSWTVGITPQTATWSDSLVVSPDSDDDGVSDAQEVIDGTDPTDPDTDDDGLTDGQEKRGADGFADSGDETDPRDADTDDDGISDGQELAGSYSRTDPLVFDTDVDGLGDGQEQGVVTGVAGGQSLGGIPYLGTDLAVFVPDAHPASRTGALLPDTDGDGLLDGTEDVDRDGFWDGDRAGTALDETDPNERDTDFDGKSDSVEGGTGPTAPDADLDGTIDALDDDGDNDGVPDSDEIDDGTDPRDPDTDGDGLTDREERDGPDGIPDTGDETRGWDADTDDDGIPDGAERSSPAFARTDPRVFDTDHDGLGDGQEQRVAMGVPGGTSDGGVVFLGTDLAVFRPDTDITSGTLPLLDDTDDDGERDGDEDVDRDGRWDGDQPGTALDETDPNRADTDGDLVGDGAEGGAGAGAPDGDTDGTIDALDVDADNDGVPDVDERAQGTDPRDGDTDGDGLGDGQERLGPDGLPGTGDETDPRDADTDDDGISDGDERAGTRGAVTDPTRFDTDRDGLSDGVEQGVTAGVLPGVSDGDGVAYAGTDPATFRADSDPDSRTDPLDPDSDDDALLDGAEDVDGDGRWDGDVAGTALDETDPNDPDTDGDTFGDALEGGTGPTAPDTDHDGTIDALDLDPGAVDSDLDGVLDAQEALDGTDPHDPDTDDDGLTDGEEKRGADGIIGTGDETNPRDADSDDDGLSDGEELAGPDGDPETDDGTDPLDFDTDGDGLGDGRERGVTAGLPGGTSDGDGVPYAGTASGFVPGPGLDTDPRDADTDDDGISDGDEVTGARGDVTDPSRFDTDDDGLGDGQEQGVATGVSGGTNPGGYAYGGTGAAFVPDGDAGHTRTDPLDDDSDDDTLRDGHEDLDRDGVFDGDRPGTADDETDPNQADTDRDGLSDAAEGGPGGPDTDGDGRIDALDNDADSDGDGVPDGDEWLVGTDPTDPDTDDDGLSDGDEIVTDTDPLDADTDDDGLSDGDEVVGADGRDATGDETDPLDPDTDGDGLTDGQELGVDTPVPGGTSAGGAPFLGTAPGFAVDADPDSTTDPLDPDTDGDGITDGTEDVNRDGAWDGDQPGTRSDETDPNLADTDDDGLTDLEEGAPSFQDSDGDETIDALDLDSDDDGHPDEEEVDAGTDPTDPDDHPEDTAWRYVGRACGCDAGGGAAGASPLLVLMVFGALRRRRAAC